MISTADAQDRCLLPSSPELIEKFLQKTSKKRFLLNRIDLLYLSLHPMDFLFSLVHEAILQKGLPDQRPRINMRPDTAYRFPEELAQTESPTNV